MLLRILARLKKEVLSKTRSAHICCEGTGVIPSVSKEWPTDGSFPDISTPTCDYSSSSFSPPSLWACFWVTQQLLGSPLLLVAPALEDNTSPMLSPSGSRVPDSLLFSLFHPSLLQGKIQISVSLLGEQENRDQHRAALGMLCSSFKKLSFKKCIRVATLCSFSVLS